MNYEFENDPFEEMEREMKFAIILTTLISTGFLIFIIWLVSFLFFSCGTSKKREICPAYATTERK